jgi:hypothetical protein
MSPASSIEQLLVRVLERFTERLIERQRQMYAADEPFESISVGAVKAA